MGAAKNFSGEEGGRKFSYKLTFKAFNNIFAVST
jgi:hypothetical protein